MLVENLHSHNRIFSISHGIVSLVDSAPRAQFVTEGHGERIIRGHLAENRVMNSKKSLGMLTCLVLIIACSTGCKRQRGQQEGTAEIGIASWYGHPFDGRPTASGEIFDMEKMTAAHRTLPLGTVVQVENLTNSRVARVRINDRGPFVKDRIIDLSHAAAEAISMPGIANVKLVVISMPATRDLGMYTVQVGAFHNRDEAESLRQQLAAKYGNSRLIFREGDQSWRVLVGFEPALEDASVMAASLEKNYRDVFVVLADSQ